MANESPHANTNEQTTESLGDPVYGGTLIYALDAETDGFNPTAGRWAASGHQTARAIFDMLTHFDEDGEIHPYLAESITPNETYDVWTIKLRPDITFHNGEPLDSNALEVNLRYHIDSPLTGPIFQEVQDTAKIDNLTLEVQLVEPVVIFPMVLSSQIGVVAAPEMLADPEGGLHPIGTGPFIFEEWEQNNFLRVSRNPDYWQHDAQGNQLPYLDGIEFLPMPDPTSRANALRGQEIDLAQVTDPARLVVFSEEATEGTWQVLSDSVGERVEAFIQLNTQAEPTDDLRVRRALALATNPVAIIDTLHDGYFDVARGPFHPESPWFIETDYPEFDLAAATALVAEWEEENGPLEIELLSLPVPVALEMVQVLQSQWQAAGITVRLKSVEQTALILSALGGDYNAVTWAQFNAPNPFLETPWWHIDYAPTPPDFALNFARNRNEVLSQALTDARQDPDLARHKQYYDIVQQELAKDLPYIWLYHDELSVVASPRLVDVFRSTLPTGESAMPFENQAVPLQQIWINPDA